MPTDAGRLTPVFLVSPIGEDGSDIRRRADLVRDFIIQAALPPALYEVRRADDESSPDAITPRIVRRIFESGLIVVDISDHNPNVFYELAIAHGYGKPVVYLAEAGTRPPFDTKDLRTIFYNLTDPRSIAEAVRKLGESAVSALDDPDGQTNPVRDAERLFSLRSGTYAVQPEVALAGTLEEVLERLQHLQKDTTELRQAVVAPKAVKAMTGSEMRRSLGEMLALAGEARNREQLVADTLAEDPGNPYLKEALTHARRARLWYEAQVSASMQPET